MTWPQSQDAFLAWLYLILFGSLAAFTAYTWVLQHAPVSRVATYAYVNPVVAVILGVIILGEVITPAMLIGGAIIVGLRRAHHPQRDAPAGERQPGGRDRR